MLLYRLFHSSNTSKWPLAAGDFSLQKAFQDFLFNRACLDVSDVKSVNRNSVDLGGVPKDSP